MRELPHSLNLPFVDDLYRLYLRNPASVSADWADYFEAIRRNGQGAIPPAQAQLDKGLLDRLSDLSAKLDQLISLWKAARV